MYSIDCTKSPCFRKDDDVLLPPPHPPASEGSCAVEMLFQVRPFSNPRVVKTVGERIVAGFSRRVGWVGCYTIGRKETRVESCPGKGEA